MKRCTVCQATKPLSEFRLESRKTGARKSRCNPCENLRQRDDRKANGTKRRASDRQAYSRRKLDVAMVNKQRFYGLSELLAGDMDRLATAAEKLAERPEITGDAG